jgi:hypothetical protein
MSLLQMLSWFIDNLRECDVPPGVAVGVGGSASVTWLDTDGLQTFTVV